MGGAGKTPFTIALAAALRRQGLQPAVLLRGYRRQDASAILALAPGQKRPVSQTGEEARLLLDACDAWVGIGADRMTAWHAISRQARIDVVLLDDGFQHWPMRRDLDIVLIDALDPFRGGVFPLGRLREPFSALRRADALVISRAQPGRAYRGLREELARHSSAPVYLAAVQPVAPTLPPGRIGAFCGLGNPESFRATLDSIGLKPVLFRAFPDHHRYDDAEIRALLRDADLLVTTEKDLANIEPAVARECRVHAIPIRMRIEPMDDLLAAIDRCLRAKAGRASR
jgi:tetraacyldisaccharide 4'-kinase